MYKIFFLFSAQKKDWLIKIHSRINSVFFVVLLFQSIKISNLFEIYRTRVAIEFIMKKRSLVFFYFFSFESIQEKKCLPCNRQCRESIQFVNLCCFIFGHDFLYSPIIIEQSIFISCVLLQSTLPAAL